MRWHLPPRDQCPHWPRFLWPWPLAQTAFWKKEEALGRAALDLPVSESGWRLCWADPPQEEMPSGHWREGILYIQESKRWDSQNWEGPAVSSTQCQPSQGQRGNKSKRGKLLQRGLGRLCCLQEPCTPRPGSAFLPFKSTRCSPWLHCFSARSCHCFESWWDRNSKSSLPSAVHAWPYFLSLWFPHYWLFLYSSKSLCL